MKVIHLALSLLTATSAHAAVETSSPIKVSTDVSTWTAEFGAKVQAMKTNGTLPASGYTECRETNEIPGAFLCQSDTQEVMNSQLGRASMFIEGLGGPQIKGTIVRLDDQTYKRNKRLIGGHDLRGEDLTRFYGALTSACAATPDPKVCPNIQEKEAFDSFIVPRTTGNPNFVVISFASQSSMSWREVVTHEIMHAQYFNDSRFRQVADDFWTTEMTENERSAIRLRLGAYYNAADELLMKNEFQAYILMAGAEMNLLYDFVPTYRARLTQKLNAAGVTPVQVQ